MATEYADRFCANEIRANNKITLRERDVMDVITDASKFTIAASPGPGESLLANGAASSTGTGDSVPVVFRNLIAGLNTTFTVTPNGLEINSSPTGVATLADGPNPATSLIYDAAGVLKTVQVANSLTLNTATPGRLIFGLTLTNTGGGASLLQNVGGQFKTVAVSSAVTMTDVAGLVTFGLNLSTTGGATSILSTAGGIFKTLGADAAVTISTAVPGQVRFGLNLTEVGGGVSILNSPAGVIRTLTGSAGLVVSNPNANTVGFASNLTDTGANQSLIRDPNAVLFQLATSGAITMSPDGASGPIRIGLALTSVGTGTLPYSNANGVFRALAAGSGIGINVVSDAIVISASGVGSLTNGSGSGVSLIFASGGVLKTLIQGTGITIADSPSGSVTITNSGVLQVQSIGSGSSMISASTGTIKSVVGGSGIGVSATTNELTITNNGVVALSSAGVGTSLVNNTTGELKSLTASRGFTIAEVSGTLTITPPLGTNANHWMRWDTGLGAWKADVLQTGSRLLPDGSSANDQYLFSASGGTTWAAITIAAGGVGPGSVLPAVGVSGNVLTSNGTTWASAAPPAGVVALSSAGSGTSLVNNTNGELKSLAATYGFTVGDSGGTVTVTPPLGSNTSHYMHWNTGTSAWEPALLQSGVRLLPVGDITKDQYLCSPSGSTTWSNIEAIPGGVGLGSVLPVVGSANNVLTSDGTSWTSQPPTVEFQPNPTFLVCGMTFTNTFVGPSSDYVIPWNSGGTMRNVNNCVTVGGGNTQFTPTRDGEYEIHVELNFANSNASTKRWVYCGLKKNAAATPFRLTDSVLAPQFYNTLPLYWIGNLTASDVITVYCRGENASDTYINNGGTPTVPSIFSIKYLGAAQGVTSTQLQILSSYGQSDYITSALTIKFPNTRHIWYNKAAIASGIAVFLNSGETVGAIEITVTTKPTMPVWPVYLWADSGGGISNLNDMPFFMLPPPGTTKTYIRYMTQGWGTRTTPAGTYTSLWDNTTTNVLGSSTSVQSITGPTSSFWGLVWTLGIIDVNGVVENYDSLAVGGINLLTSPGSSAYFSAIQIRGRY